MEQNTNAEEKTLDSYIKGLKNQEIKGILLKLKNEIRKADVDRDLVQTILLSLKEKDPQTAKEAEELIDM